MKNKILNICILVLAVSLVLYFTLKDNFKEILNELKNVNVFIFLIAIVVLMLSLLFKSAGLKTFINEYHSGYSLKSAYSLTVIGQFLNGITPFQSGGQPFQIYLLKKEGVRITDSTNAMIKDFIAFQSALILMGIFALIANMSLNVFPQNKYFNLLILVGFIINVIVLLLLFVVSVAKTTGTKIINKIIDFFFKFKIINKLGITKDKAKESLKHFYETSQEVKSNKTSMLLGILYNLIHLILLYIIPFIIFKSLGTSSVSILGSIVSTAFVMLIGNFIPIPGATGGIEYGFIQFFGGFITGPILSGAMLLWRLVTYFFGMIIGFITLLLKKEVKNNENRSIH